MFISLHLNLCNKINKNKNIYALYVEYASRTHSNFLKYYIYNRRGKELRNFSYLLFVNKYYLSTHNDFNCLWPFFGKFHNFADVELPLFIDDKRSNDFYINIFISVQDDQGNLLKNKNEASRMRQGGCAKTFQPSFLSFCPIV